MRKPIDRLKSKYERKGICLGIGAGISIDSGLPLWNDLLRKVSREISNSEEVFEDFLKNGYSYEAFASYLKVMATKKKKDFSELLRNGLYDNFSFHNRKVNKRNRTEFKNDIHCKNQSLKAVGSFCALKKKNSTRFIANDRVHGVINFNIDVILQAYCYAKFEKRLLRTVERASAGRMADKINVYHVHGMLRFDGNRGRDRESPDKIVLSEGEYYELFSNSNAFVNYTFLHLLREYSFLFLGLSMQDSNLRRLLHLSKMEILRGYIEENLSEGQLKSKIIRSVNKHFAVMKRTGHRQTDEFHSVTLLNLGVRVIWIDQFEEIPEVLEYIYSFEDRQWADVF